MTPIPSGFAVSVSVRQAADKGRGVFAAEDIAAGAIIWRFISGNYAVFDEAGLNAHLAGKSDDDVRYELTHMFGFPGFPGWVIRVLDDGVLINHAEDGNVATNFARPAPALAPPGDVEAVTKALTDDRYALIATRPIKLGEELVNDYEADIVDPPFLERLFECYEVDESYLD